MEKEDMPLGLGFGLALNDNAMKNFANMDEQEKRQVLEAARSVRSKPEMEHLIDDIARLSSK